MKKILLKHLAALKKVSMLFIVYILSINMAAQIITESFEDPIFPPLGWKTSNYSFFQYSGDASQGTKSACIGAQNKNGYIGGILTTLPIALTAGQTIKISFDYKVADSGDNGGEMNIYASTSNDINIIGVNNYIYKEEFTGTGPYTTVNITFIAEETADYYIMLYVVGEANTISNKNMFKFLLDKVIVENIQENCLPPTNITATQIASNVFNLNWNETGNEISWEVQLTNGEFPVPYKWMEATENQKDIDVNPGRTYSAYVRSKCPGGEYSSFYGPEVFIVPCPEIITAPYTVPFITTNLPECWQQSGDTNWTFSTKADYAAKDAGDHSTFEAYTQYAWVDGTFNLSNKKATLLSPKVDVSGLMNPAIEFYVYSENNNNDVFNELLVEVSNGTTWQQATILATSTNGWKFYSIDLTALNITTVTQVRITVTGNAGSEETHYNDILIDDISFREKTTCLPLRNFSTDMITDVNAGVSWNSDNNVNTWDIAYKKYGIGFDGIANFTGISNSYTLNELEADTQYQIYIRSNCGNGAVGEWTGPYNFKTDCSILVPYYQQPFKSQRDAVTFVYRLPNCWTKASGGNLTNGPSEYGTGGWLPNNDALYGIIINSEAVTFSFIGADVKSWLLSPLFNLSEGHYEAKIKIGIDPGNTSLISMGSDDKVQMLYSVDGTNWQVLRIWSAADNLTTGYHTSIVSLEGITGENIRFAFLADEGAVVDDILYKFHLDDLIIREKSSCLESINLSVDGITNISAKLSWENPGTASSWRVAVVPTGVTPTNEWQTVSTNLYLAEGLTANTVYDFYVKSVCGSIDTEVVTGPFKFKTKCTPIVAPYTETFVEYYMSPECWMFNPLPIDQQLFIINYWNFTTDSKFDSVLAGDHTEGGGTQYAWLNTGGLNNKERGSLSSPIVDVSSLQHPTLQFYLFSKNTIDSALNHVLVEIYNGSEWVEATRIGNYTNSWAPYTIDLTALGATGIVEVRFTVIVNANGGNAGYNQILIDDVAFIEMPQCPAPFNLAVTEISDISAEVTWENTGTSTSWEVEYGPKGFIPGEGTVVTVNNTPEIILTDLDDNQEYDVYIKSSCDSELVGPQTFITDTTSGTNDFDITKIILYPNPVTDILNIESNTTIDTIEVYTIVGQLVKKQSFNTNSAIVAVSDLSEGIYMIKAFSGKNVGTYKIIKK